MQASSTLILIKPKHFAFNSETALTNSFQNSFLVKEDILLKATNEFDNVVNCLLSNGISCLVFEDRNEIVCADAVFCNNWFSTHSNGKVFLYPLCTPNRQLEFRQDIIDDLQENFKVTEIIDVRNFANENEFLESTGSLVFDHNNKLAFACLSPRTNKRLVHWVCKNLGYSAILYTCVDENDLPIYHTNVILCVTSKLIVAYIDGTKNATEKENLQQQITLTQKEVLFLNYLQVKAFCGNMLAVKNKEGKEFLVLSNTSFNAFTEVQLAMMQKLHQLIVVNIPTIETIGGGGVRCMLGQVFLERK